METMICNDGHPEIRYRQKDCPACYLKEEIENLQKDNEQRAKEVERLQKEIDDFENETAGDG